MEFEEMQRIWDSQERKTLYAIDEKALHNRINVKKNKGIRITNVSELIIVFTNAIAGITVFLVNQDQNFFLYCFAGWAMLSALLVLAVRIRRLAAPHEFNHSLTSDLDHAIAVATYQVRLSRVMRWNAVPMVLFLLLALWEDEQSIWVIGSIVVFFIIVFYASGMEHNYYKSRLRELQILRSKLEHDE